MTISQPTRPRVPWWAIGLSAAAGVLMIANAVYWLTQNNIWNDPAPVAMYSVVFCGVVFGLVVLFSAIHLRSRPEHKMTWGAAIMLFSLFSLVTVGGGFVVGFALGIIGGGLAVARGQEGQ